MANVQVACIQMNSGLDIDENLKQAGEMIRDAAREGCEFIATPENTDFMAANKFEALRIAQESDKHPGIPFFSFLAKELGVWILIGSMKIKIDDKQLVNRSFLFNDKGQLTASYDKIHMFDVDLPNGESHRESETCAPGDKVIIVNTPWKKLGMSVCYDVRFPSLYREMAQNEAEMIAVPAAFTAETGKAHWKILLRARAIETGSFIIAPAQGGQHPGDRQTYGHSMIIGPWGKVLEEKNDDEPGYITSKLDFLDVTKARHAIPSLKHDRNYTLYKAKDFLH
jgi:predicted amidohydrolase